MRLLSKVFEKNELKYLGKFYLNTLIIRALALMMVFLAFYFLSIGFNLFQIGLLISAQGIGSLLFEIPTGAIADLFGRKKSVILGHLSQAIVILCIYFTTNFYFVLILFFLIGVTETLMSGAYEAWIIDNLKYKKKNNLIKEYFIKRTSIGNLGWIIAGLVGALLVKLFGLNIIWLATCLALVLAVIPLIITKEHRIKNKTKIKESILSQSKKAIKFSIKHHIMKILFICLFIVIVWSTFAGPSIVWQPFLKELGISEYIYGFVFTIMGVAGILSPFLIKPLGRLIKKESRQLAILRIFTILILLSVLFINNYIIAAIILALTLFIGQMFWPIHAHFMQKQIPSKIRATTTSIESMIISLAYIIVFPLVGFIADTIGLRLTISLSGIILIPAIILYWRLNK